MEFIKPNVNFDFIGKRKWAFVFSGTLILISIISLVVKGGPNYGIDFAGGIMVQAKFSVPTDAGDVRNAVSGVAEGTPMVQRIGAQGSDEYLIRVERASESQLNQIRQGIESALKSKFGADKVDIRRVEVVGPKVGSDLRTKALFALFYAIVFISIYISGRFEFKWTVSIITCGSLLLVVYVISLLGWSVMVLVIAALIAILALCWFFRMKYALGAVIALIHDITITVGAFSLLNKEMSLTIVAALLTILGYSLNDTIIIFDRIRENLRKSGPKDFAGTMNSAINQTLSRTILTSGTVILVVVALLVLGGGVIHDFAFALLVGVIIGTYSSIFVASPVLLIWQERFDSGRRKARSA